MLQLKIVSPEKVVFQGEVESVLVPGTSVHSRFSRIMRYHLFARSGQGGIHYQGRQAGNEHQGRIRGM